MEAKSIRQLCRENNIKYSAVQSYKKSKGLTNISAYELVNSYINYKANKGLTVKEKCEIHGVSYASVMVRHKKTGESYDKTIEYYVKYRQNIDNNITRLSKQAGVKPERAIAYRNKHPEMTNEEIVELLKSKLNSISISEQCRLNNVSYTKVLDYKANHGDLTLDEIIRHVKEKDSTESLRAMCIKFNVKPQSASKYMSRHPWVTREEAICHFNKDCYINILGKITMQ